ncbi:MAG TPA: response regulator [Holophagaceae bacterium]|nr:response regulator [Holophagaceae bacterium]
MAKALSRILAVEDEPDIRSVLELCLRSLGGFTVLSCASGEEALGQAEAFAPDLLLLDVMMPSLDGPDTLRALRKRPPLAQVPAIFLTAKVRPQELQQLRELGAAGVVAKPFDPATLCGEIERIWAGAQREDLHG